MKDYRIEHDVLGEVKVPADACWMSQTQRSLENFRIGQEKMPASLIRAFALLKMACAIANYDEKKITLEQKEAIIEVCQAILAGEYAGHDVDRAQLVPLKRLADRQRHPDQHERQ